MITPKHLAPFVAAFSLALQEKSISVEQAREFCVDVYDATLAQIVVNNKPYPRGKRHEEVEDDPDAVTGDAG